MSEIRDFVNKTRKEKESDIFRDRCKTNFDIKPCFRVINEIDISHKDSKSVLKCCDGR